MSTIDLHQKIESVLEDLDWSERRKVSTRNGERWLTTAPLFGEDLFWELWREHGGEVKALGYSVKKEDEEWVLNRWQAIDGEQDEVIEEIKARNAEEIARQQAVPEISLPTEISDKLLDFQIPSCKRIIAALHKHSAALDGSDLGSGKTYVAIATAKYLGLKIAIICPKAVIPSWRRVLRHFDYIQNCVMLINYEMVRTGNTPYGKWDQKKKVFTWSVPLGTIDSQVLMVFDEAQKCKTDSTQNCKIAVAAIRQAFKVLGVSGTIAKDPTEMYFSGQLAKLHRGGGEFYSWMHRNGVVKSDFGFFYKGGRAMLARINSQIYPEHGSRIRIADVPNYPTCTIEAEAYDCGKNTSKIQDVYKIMMDKLAEIETMDGKSKSEKTAMSLAEQMKARREAETLKIPVICEMVQDYIENGRSVVVFTNFRDTVASFQDALETDCIVQGGQKDEVRERNIQDFQDDKERVIVVNIQSGGSGLSLHDLSGRFPRVSIICPSWSAVDIKQSTGRIWRAGAKSPAMQIVFYASDTIEQDICERVREKLKNIDAINDGDLAPKGLF